MSDNGEDVNKSRKSFVQSSKSQSSQSNYWTSLSKASLLTRSRTIQRNEKFKRMELAAIGIDDPIPNGETTSNKDSDDQATVVFHPDSQFRKIWNMVILVCITISFFRSPAVVAFQPGNFSSYSDVYLSKNQEWDIAIFGVSLLISLLYIVDIFISIRSGYKMLGAVVMDPALIKQQYLQKQFIWDLLATFSLPIDIYAMSVGFRYKPRGISFFKLLDLCKLKGVSTRWRVVEELLADTTGTLRTQVLTLVLSLAILCNMNACIWFAVQAWQPQGLQQSWIYGMEDLQQKIDDWVSGEVATQSVAAELYITCLYWSSGAEDGFNATNTAERITAIFAQFVMVYGMGAYIVASLMRSLESYDYGNKRHEMYRQKIDMVNVYMNKHDVPKNIVGLIRSYYKDVWVRQQVDYGDFALLSELPDVLKQPVLGHVTYKMLMSSQFFEDYLQNKAAVDVQIDENEKQKWARSISKYLRPKFCLPGESVVTEGELGSDMYIIKTGKVAVEVGERLVAYQASGSYFGDIALMATCQQDQIRTATVRAITYCELYMLSQKDMREVFREHGMLHHIMAVAASHKFHRARSTHGRPTLANQLSKETSVYSENPVSSIGSLGQVDGAPVEESMQSVPQQMSQDVAALLAVSSDNTHARSSITGAPGYSSVPITDAKDSWRRVQLAMKAKARFTARLQHPNSGYSKSQSRSRDETATSDESSQVTRAQTQPVPNPEFSSIFQQVGETDQQTIPEEPTLELVSIPSLGPTRPGAIVGSCSSLAVDPQYTSEEQECIVEVEPNRWSMQQQELQSAWSNNTSAVNPEGKPQE